MELHHRNIVHEQPNQAQLSWSDEFTGYLKDHFHGAGLQALAQPKPEVAAIAEHFGGTHMPADALEVAKVAHIAELGWHLNLSPNITRGLSEAFGEAVDAVTLQQWETDADALPLKYTFGLIRDFPVIADFIKEHEAKCERLGQEYINIQGLVDLVERVNFESIIIKSALDYSNFLLLDEKEYLTEKEKTKMRRIITTIKTVDSPLLALTGFDALEAEILSKAYKWELNQAGNGYFVTEAQSTFDKLGGRQALAQTAEAFMEDLFAHDTFRHTRVSSDQDNYEIYFADGTAELSEEQIELRVLSRLKSTGSTAKKMHALYNRTEQLEKPMDIIGITLIAKDKDEMQTGLHHVLKRLSALNAEYRSAPSRTEEVHVKGRPDFIQMFGKDGSNSSLYRENGLAVMDEPCDNGYEAVKLTLIHSRGGIEIPIEIQITHETARKESRVGLGSHTIFKLMKLAKESAEVTVSLLSNDELLERLQRISARKQKFDKSSYETNGESTVRANHLFNHLKRRARRIGNVALRH